MKKANFLLSLALAVTVLVAQVGAVFASPASITGTVQSITLETDTNTAVTTVLVTVLEKGATQIVRIGIDSATALGLVTLGGDGNPIINESALGQPIEIDPATVIPDQQEDEHPVGNALAAFFSDILNLDYETIMTAHDNGTGFGVIAQALWLTKKLDGDADLFLAILEAKKSKDYSAFLLEDGTIPQNWGQFKKAVMDGKKGKPGIAVREKDNNGNDNNGNGNGNGQDKDKEKNKDKDKDNNGNGNGNNK